jgi:hypothetical protein
MSHGRREQPAAADKAADRSRAKHAFGMARAINRVSLLRRGLSRGRIHIVDPVAPVSRSIFFSVKRTLKQANLETGSGRTVAEEYHPHIE